MNDREILGLANKCSVIAVSKHEWDGKQFNHTDDLIEGDAAGLIQFARLLMAVEREACAKLADDWPDYNVQGLAEAIRARGDVHASDTSEKHVHESDKHRHEFAEMVKKGTKAWAGTPDNWVDELRGGAEKREWVGLSVNEAREFYESNLSRADLINKIDEFLEEKNNG